MDVDERLALVMREPIEEVVTVDELHKLLETKAHPKHYIGLEISGVLHLGSLVLTGFKINHVIQAGINTTVFLADWHTYINNKLGGDWDKIRDVSQYYAEAFRFFCPGVNIVLGSDLYNNTKNYWEDIVHAGMDQRKIHMLVREIFPKLGWKVPVVLHHHLLPGLLEPMQTSLDEKADEDIRI